VLSLAASRLGYCGRSYFDLLGEHIIEVDEGDHGGIHRPELRNTRLWN